MEFVMRTLAVVAFAAACFGAGAAIAAPVPLFNSANNPLPLLEAKLVCGMFDGKFKCKNIKDGTVGIEIGGDNKGTGNDNGGDDAGGAGGGGVPAGGGGDGGAGGGGAPADAGGAGGANGGNATEDGTEAAGACPEGYKRIDPPSKFGPCEPPEGLPNNAYVQCPSGATGTPPNCVCPGQSDYGDKGNKCRHWSGACGTDKPGWNTDNFFCKNSNPDKTDCTILADGNEKCCCKKYD
jgi:hypothetical protein